MKIYVGNLNFKTTQETLEEIYSEFGKVEEVVIVTDRKTGRPTGYGFVMMDDEAGALRAIEATNGLELEGRSLTVNMARNNMPRNNDQGSNRRSASNSPRRPEVHVTVNKEAEAHKLQAH